MDKRIVKTRRLLGEALIETLNEQAYKDITIRQITERANIAYSTFFRNFDSLDDLLLSHLRDFIKTVSLAKVATEKRSYREQSFLSIKSLFEQVEATADMHRVMFATPAAQPVLNTLRDELTLQNINMLENMAIPLRDDHVPIELVMRSAIAQLMAIIEWWLEKDCQPSPEQMAHYHEQLVTIPIWHHLLGEEEAFYRLGIPVSNNQQDSI
ncbi:MAG: TetR-like C-terminal domain-containing protein [Chloroflexota bacterium]